MAAPAHRNTARRRREEAAPCQTALDAPQRSHWRRGLVASPALQRKREQADHLHGQFRAQLAMSRDPQSEAPTG